MTDHLPAQLYLTELWTGTYNENLLYDAEYMTNRSDGWILWESGLSTGENHHLLIPKELRTKQEHVIKFRLRFGTVGGDFEKVKPPVYMTYVSPDAEGTIINEIELTAEHNGKKLKDKDRTETILYLKQISGYGPEGGGGPLYEVSENGLETGDRELLLRRRTTGNSGGEDTETIEDESVPKAGPGEGTGAQTGDHAPSGVLFALALLTAVGFIVLSRLGKRKE